MASATLQHQALFNGAAAYQINTHDTAVRQPRELPQERPRREQAKQQRTLSLPLTILGIVAAACVMVLLVFAHMRLYAVTSETTKLRSQLSSMESELSELQGQYNGMIDYREIEADAMTRLGMAKPNGSQTVYLSLAGADRGEVLTHGEGPFSSAANLFSDAFTNLSAYLSAPAT